MSEEDQLWRDRAYGAALWVENDFWAHSKLRTMDPNGSLESMQKPVQWISL